jgi:small-conductance mechanosensitive channel
MDISRAFGFVTQDERWVTKVLIGGLVFLIPLIGQIVVMGYSYQVAKNVAAGVERPLPEWSDFGDMLARGFMAWVIQLVYTLPLLVVYFIFLIFISAAGAASSDSESAGGAAALLLLCLTPILIILALACSAASIAAIARFIATDRFGEAFKVGAVLQSLRENLGTFAMLLLVGILAGVVASLGAIACFVGVFFTSFYAYLVLGHALGQVLPRFAPPRDQPFGYPPQQVL